MHYNSPQLVFLLKILQLQRYSYLWDAACEVVERKLKDSISKGMTRLKANMYVNKIDIFKSKGGTTYDNLAPK